ncbi:hypothetical protein KFK09_015416 [Dendrobium nobile]|uniref:Uncharacterized protein n=1 Tax=Dendrobium nobile TaxID=94219 RepID=A0A8T3B4R3_DENNO|nr:hypothetical protein KFK09_015416 [Dendrobium nobile]
MTTAVEIFAPDSFGAGRRCDSEFCPVRNPWPLHHVVHRANFRRLCTSCVLRHHRGLFCSVCLEVLDSVPPPSGDTAVAGIARCLRCPAAAHSSCLPDDSASNYLCPICEDPEGFSYFPVGDNAIDEAAARALLSASRIAAASMSRAAAAARVEAERKVKLAAVARKTAKEMLETVTLLSNKRKEEMEEADGKDRMKENSSSVNKNEARKVKKKKKKMITLSSSSGLLKKL